MFWPKACHFGCAQYKVLMFYPRNQSQILLSVHKHCTHDTPMSLHKVRWTKYNDVCNLGVTLNTTKIFYLSIISILMKRFDGNSQKGNNKWGQGETFKLNHVLPFLNIAVFSQYPLETGSTSSKCYNSHLNYCFLIIIIIYGFLIIYGFYIAQFQELMIIALHKNT